MNARQRRKARRNGTLTRWNDDQVSPLPTRGVEFVSGPLGGVWYTRGERHWSYARLSPLAARPPC